MPRRRHRGDRVTSKVIHDTASRTVIAFVVRVPVLSLQMTEVQPSVSTDGKRLTTTRRAAILLMGASSLESMD